MEEDESRERKLQELKEKIEKKQREAEAEAQLNSMMRSLLTEEARARLNNVKLVNNELYLRAVQAIVYLYRAGRLGGKLGEAELKGLLEKMSAKREIKIKRR